MPTHILGAASMTTPGGSECISDSINLFFTVIDFVYSCCCGSFSRSAAEKKNTLLVFQTIIAIQLELWFENLSTERREKKEKYPNEIMWKKLRNIHKITMERIKAAENANNKRDKTKMLQNIMVCIRRRVQGNKRRRKKRRRDITEQHWVSFGSCVIQRNVCPQINLFHSRTVE